MTIPCNTIAELQRRIASYLMEDRPLNLDEMRNAANLLADFTSCCKDVVKLCRNHKFNPFENLQVSVLEKQLGANF